MANAQKPKTIKVTYNGNDPRPNGMLGGSIPIKGNTYVVPMKTWESKNQDEWKAAKSAPKKAVAKKKPVTEKD